MIDKVKQGILKNLRAQAGLTAGGGAGPASQPAPPAPVACPPPPPTTNAVRAVEKIPGVEICGDEAWFADATVRKALQEKVVAAHAEQKILVGHPADEIRRICPGGGRVLGAGAVLRLGGSHLGGYGDNDIAYAYRHLSRALHPDKNPGIPEAADAFRRLSEAADELRQGLSDARELLVVLCDAMGGAVCPEMTERPQEALFAEASRVLSGVLGLAGEGATPAPALYRATVVFATSPLYPACDAQALLALWFHGPNLVDSFASAAMRTAYDCAPKHLRAMYICALSRVIAVEERRFDGLRGNWQAVATQFPELGFWREFREKLRARVSERGSKWDSKAQSQISNWARSWRDKVRDLLARGPDEAVPMSDLEVRRLSVDLWADITTWAREECGMQWIIELFTAEGKATEWSFVPASDLLLIVAEGMVGLTAEGVFLEALQGIPAPSDEPENMRDLTDDRRDDRRPSKRDAQVASQGKDFDWEKVWRTKMQSQKMKNNHRRAPAWQRGHSPIRSSSSGSRVARKRRRSGSTERRKKSTSRGRKRRR